MMNLSQEGKRESQNKESKSDNSNADPSEDGLNYSIDCLNLLEPVNDSQNDSELLLAQHREGHMTD